MTTTIYNDEIDLDGPDGIYGPNDQGYIHQLVREAGRILGNATYLWSEGHYPHSNARVMPDDHPLAIALAQLSELDRTTARYNNMSPDPDFFKPYYPPLEHQTRWDKYEGATGHNDEEE